MLDLHGADTTFGAIFFAFLIFISILPLFFDLFKKEYNKTFFIFSLILLLSYSRIFFSLFPSIQPVTSSLILIGAFFGKRYVFSFACLVTLISNFYLGHGSWTLYQIIAWSCIGYIGSSLSKTILDKNNHPKIITFSIISFVSSLPFSFIVSLSALKYGVPQYFNYLQNGILFDIIHAFSNLFFAVIIGLTIRMIYSIPQYSEARLSSIST
tara:strand:+ start:155 stop:787 length:633 start_codon:yes stop_codon:yes gene_type:complete